jgi:hypothetical protein
MCNASKPDLSNYTLLLVEGNTVLFTSEDRGIAPLLACLARYAGYGGRCRIISQPAKDFLVKHGVRLQAEEIVPGIINRTKNGICPAETIALTTEDTLLMIILLSQIGQTRPP